MIQKFGKNSDKSGGNMIIDQIIHNTGTDKTNTKCINNKPSSKYSLCPSKFKLIWRWLCAICGAILTIAGIYYNYSSKLTIEAEVSLNPQDPFATPFSIRNDSIFDLRSVHCETFIRKLRTLKDGDVIGDSSLIGILPPIPNLESGESTTFFVSANQIGYDSPYCYADVEIIVSFRPVFLPYRKTVDSRFSTEIAIDGTLHWIQRAKSE